LNLESWPQAALSFERCKMVRECGSSFERTEHHGAALISLAIIRLREPLPAFADLLCGDFGRVR
jgi:hypothetical protein